MKELNELQIASIKDQAIIFYGEALDKTKPLLQDKITFFQNGISRIEVSAGYKGFQFSFTISGPECCP